MPLSRGQGIIRLLKQGTLDSNELREVIEPFLPKGSLHLACALLCVRFLAPTPG